MATPTTTTQYQTGIAPELAPFAQSLLGQAQAYTNVSQNPYQSYTGEQVAGYSPLQQQSYDAAKQLTSAPQLQDASALAGMAGLGALNTQYTFQPSNFTSADAANLMNPYMQNVVDVQSQQAKRQADIAAQANQAKATSAGAFGGGRDMIQRAQSNAELQRNLQGIQATGLNNAYNQAMQQFNTQNQLNAQQQQFGAGLGLQGLQTANTAATNLANIGNTQYNENLSNVGTLNQLGLQQQQQAQNVLNTQYQDWLNAQNYPYKQMAFMSDIIRGTPMSQTGSTVYQAAPSTLSQLTGLGATAIGAAGMYKMLGSGTPGGKAGGQPKDFKPVNRPAGLAELAIHNMG